MCIRFECTAMVDDVRMCSSSLGAEGREGARVSRVDAATLATATTTELATVATAAPSAASAPIASELATAFAASTSTTPAASATTVAGVSRRVVLAVEVESVLVLLLALAASLLLGADEEVLRFALDLRAGRELLLGALVRFARLQAIATQSQTLLGLLGEILIVRLGLLLGLGSGLLANSLASLARAVAESRIATAGVGSPSSLVLRFCSSNRVPGLLISPLAGASVLTPAVRCLLLVGTKDCIS